MKSHIYAIRSGPHIKFGVARNVQRRIQGLQVSSPVELTLLAFLAASSKGEAHYVEQELHRVLSHIHARGEWFVLCEDSLHVARLMNRSESLADFLPALDSWRVRKLEIEDMFTVRGNMERLERTA